MHLINIKTQQILCSGLAFYLNSYKYKAKVNTNYKIVTHLVIKNSKVKIDEVKQRITMSILNQLTHYYCVFRHLMHGLAQEFKFKRQVKEEK